MEPPPSSQDPLAVLLSRNLNKVFVQQVGRKGFLNKLDKITYIGLTGVISERFPRVTKAVFRQGLSKGAAKAAPRPAGQKASSPKLGSAFHATVLHSMVCLRTGRPCTCPSSSEQVTVTKEVEDMVRAAMALFAHFQLEALCGELIVHSNVWRLGARLDMIAVRKKDPTEMVLVSWKTSGTCPFPAGVEIAEFGEVLLNRGCTRVQSSQDYVAQSHLAQLACELNMLWDSHGVYNIRYAVIMYVFAGATLASNPPRAVWLGPNSCKQVACATVANVLAEAAHLSAR